MQSFKNRMDVISFTRPWNHLSLFILVIQLMIVVFDWNISEMTFAFDCALDINGVVIYFHFTYMCFFPLLSSSSRLHSHGGVSYSRTHTGRSGSRFGMADVSTRHQNSARQLLPFCNVRLFQGCAQPRLFPEELLP